jgi:hypothetical protein
MVVEHLSLEKSHIYIIYKHAINGLQKHTIFLTLPAKYFFFTFVFIIIHRKQTICFKVQHQKPCAQAHTQLFIIISSTIIVIVYLFDVD